MRKSETERVGREARSTTPESAADMPPAIGVISPEQKAADRAEEQRIRDAAFMRAKMKGELAPTQQADVLDGFRQLMSSSGETSPAPARNPVASDSPAIDVARMLTNSVDNMLTSGVDAIVDATISNTFSDERIVQRL